MRPAKKHLTSVICVAIGLAGFAVGVGQLIGLSPLTWTRRATIEPWRGVRHLDLELDLRKPPHFKGVAELRISGKAGPRLEFLLNRSLTPDRVTDGSGRPVAWHAGPRLRSDFHGEARIIAIELGELPAQDERLLRIEYSGRGMDGTEGRDWRGILLLAPDELRMSVQTVFYPQVPTETDGPGVEAWPTRLRVLTPRGFEAYAPGKPTAWETAATDGRAWSFVEDQPTVLSFIAAPLVRRETQLGDARVVTLLWEPHAAHGEAVATEAERVLSFYSERFGKIGARTLGIVEIHGRGDSYNWAAQGLITFDRGALREGVPADTVAHEIAHLWWGQEIVAFGRGERFLTESLAEYSSWRYLAQAWGEEAANKAEREARGTWLRRVHGPDGVDEAVFDVRFATKGYTELAYSKGPLALASLARRIGPEALDKLLASCVASARSAGGRADAKLFEEALQRGGIDVGREVPWLVRPGHAHLSLAGVECKSGRVTGRASLLPCPAGAPALLPATVMLEVRSAGGRERFDLKFDGPTAQFDVATAAEPLLVELDPDGCVLGVPAEPVYRGATVLVSSEPADGAKGVPLGRVHAKLRFGAPLGPLDESLQPRIKSASFDQALEQKTGNLTIAGARLEDAGRTLVLDLDGTTPDQEHVVVIPAGALGDADGIPLPPLRLRFWAVGATGQPRPRIIESDPAPGARGVPCDLASIRIVFASPMRAGRGFRQHRVAANKSEGWLFPELSDSHWEDTRTLIWKLGKPLQPGSRYALPFDALMRSELGIGMEDFDLRFETAPAGR